MAKATAICKCATCGKEFSKSTVMPSKRDANSWESWARDYYDECEECREKRIILEREAASKAASEDAKDLGLPELTGSEKQVSWAETIRMEGLEKGYQMVNGYVIVDAQYDYELGLVVDDKYVEF